MADRLARHKSPAALILVDVINHFESPDGQRILRQALPVTGVNMNHGRQEP